MFFLVISLGFSVTNNALSVKQKDNKFIDDFIELKNLQFNNKVCCLEENYTNELIKTHSPSKALKKSKDPQIIWVNTSNVYMLHDFHSSDMVAFEDSSGRSKEIEKYSAIVGKYGQFIKKVNNNRISFLYDKSRQNYFVLKEDFNIFVNKHVLAGKYIDASGNKYVFTDQGKYYKNDKEIGLYEIATDLMMGPRNNLSIDDFFTLKFQKNNKSETIYFNFNKKGQPALYSIVSENYEENSIVLKEKVILTKKYDN